MPRIFHFLALGAASLLLASCGAGGGEGAADAGTPETGYRVKSGEMFDDDSDKMLGKYGAMNPMYGGEGDGDASEASKVNGQFNSAYAKRDFEGKNYDRKSFWGKKDYASKVYDGGTDASRFQEGAREGGLWAREGGLVSNDTGRSYDRGREFGGSAVENSQSKLGRPSDAETDVRRRVYKQPKVEDVQRKRALTIEDTKSMLGR